MSEKLKILSGKEVVRIFEKYGAVAKRITGSHVRISGIKENASINITIPLHREVKNGTLRSITKDFEVCFGDEAMRLEFYHK